VTPPFPLAPYRRGMAEVVTSVFSTLLGVSPGETQEPPTQGSYAACAVYYAGAWLGALLVECTREQAMDWGAKFMSLEPPVSAADARDALGEMSNVLAGNLKPLLPPGVGLSIPSVVQGSDFSFSICGGSVSETIFFRDELGVFRVTLVQLLP
jgi:chemotaxis protein CheX